MQVSGTCGPLSLYMLVEGQESAVMMRQECEAAAETRSLPPSAAIACATLSRAMS